MPLIEPNLGPDVNASVDDAADPLHAMPLDDVGQPALSVQSAPPEESFGHVLGDILQTLVLAIIFFLLIRNVVQNFRIEGISMEPNFHDGQFLFINRWAYCPGVHLDVSPLDFHFSRTRCLWQPQRGDVIVFRYPRDPSKDYIKRVIGLPGESVEVRNGEVFINGQALPEPFQPNPGTYSSPATVVPAGQVYVMGDNRNNSSDSHLWGPLPEDDIVGRAWLSYWPPSLWNVVPRWDFSTLEAKN